MHSSHAYQNAAQRVGHRKVTLAVVEITVFFLLPVSILVALSELSVVGGVFIAFAPLIYIAYRLRAGKVQ